MQYMLSIYEDEAAYEGGQDGEAWQAIIKAHTEFGEALEKAGIIRGGEGLENAHTATTLKRGQGKTIIHDGPFLETKEQLGGFYIIEVDDLDAAIAWAEKIPLAGKGAIEIRPCMSGPAK